ncbi:uncharacterized protein LOC131881716 [Tigriopus californicus]|uniref:uncharacterized protein LOC131881716 n=1 Tax=Tigriopus californicus TaxID=6832 RepID=UPI0027DA16D0|nr:uncharacterized protein LOC131881716 [Tigriopus californicus]
MYCSEKLLSALYHQLEDGSLYVKGSCEASMTSNVTYKPIVKIKTDGAIGDSTCTCKARSDGKCVHVAVLLLMVEDLVQGNEPKMYCPSTSKSQYWGHGSLKRKDPIALHARTYNKKRKPDRYLQHDVLAKTVENPSQATLKRIFQGLQRESMWDRLLTYVYENYLCSPTRKQELITNVMELMNNLENDAKGFSNDPLSNSFCVHATGTVGQADVPLWMELRKWRVTGSNFKSFTSDNPSVVAKSVWRNQDLPDLRALKWGQDHESVARKEYEETTGDTIVETGLFICKENYVFGYSPDGLIVTDGLLEIKCPFSLRELEFEELADLPAVKKSGLPFTFDQHGVHLRRTHAYFYQVHLGMFVMGRKFADFMV